MSGSLASTLISRARQASGLTQTALAQRSGEAQPVISAYERGRRQPSASALNRLIEAAGFRLIVVPAPRPALDPGRAGDHLAAALELAAALPTRRRPAPLAYPRLPA